MKLTKKHKLYIRNIGGAIRRLDKLSPLIYLYLIDYFLIKTGNDKYNELNKNVTHWTQFKPLLLDMPHKLNKDMDMIICIFGKSQIEVLYGGSWKPLAILNRCLN